MLVVPVLDLRTGQVVHAVAGRRDQYAPVRSTLVHSAEPAAVARALVEQLGAGTLYVADLDAILERKAQWDCWSEIARSHARLWIDAGIRSAEQAEAFQQSAAERSLDVAQWIVGLESLEEPAELARTCRRLGAERATFSLDMKQGKLLVRNASAWPQTPDEVARLAIDAGFQQIILLDLFHVGSQQGVAVAPLCRRLAETYPHVRWVAGGGVRARRDLIELAEARCYAALVATAVHRGQLTRACFETAERVKPAW